MVVSVMSGHLYASVMALEGYCAFHHLFLMLLEEFPELKTLVDETISSFIKNSSDNRNKKNYPALGEWIPLLTVTDTYSWQDVASAYLEEMFDRNVLWSLKKFPELVEWTSQDFHSSEPKAQQRLKKTFEASLVSEHLLMFHVYFLDHVARPPAMSLSEVRQLLDLRLGKPTFGMKDQLMRECKVIHSIKNWDQWFRYIHVRPPSESSLLKMFHNALKNSESKNYHKSWQFRKILQDTRDDKRKNTLEREEKKRNAKNEEIERIESIWDR